MLGLAKGQIDSIFRSFKIFMCVGPEKGKKFGDRSGSYSEHPKVKRSNFQCIFFNNYDFLADITPKVITGFT